MSERAEAIEEVFAGELPLRATGTDGGGAAALRQMANERLAAHRSRRAQVEAEQAAAESAARERTLQTRAASRAVRDAVKQRYEKTVSYHDFLALEAERALAQAQAEIEVATRKAAAVAEAQLKLLGEIEQWRETQPGPRAVAIDAVKREQRHELADAVAAIAEAATAAFEPEVPQPRIEFAPAPADRPLSAPPTAAQRAAGFTVRMYEELSAADPSAQLSRNTAAPHVHDEREAVALDEEIAFRRAPALEDFRVQPVAIPGNVIEFPRPLVAARKVRPRRAEGPLLDESPAAPQLRIFEVEPELVSTAPAPVAELAPEWQALVLPAQAEAQPTIREAAQAQLTTPPQVARTSLRLMSLAVDGAILGAALLAMVVASAKVAGPTLALLPLPGAIAAAAVSMAVLALVYRLLFYTFAEATPGMRYARIAFCTFGEAYPTRRQLRRRVVASVLAACPLMLGFAWVLMDDERLGWHDRISRMYPRAY